MVINLFKFDRFWACGCGAAFCLSAVSVSVEAKENILLIVADDLGADSVGLYSSVQAPPTPVIDSLASNGVTFTNAWANPSCAPSRATILTGRHAFRTTVGNPGDDIALSEFTIPQALKTANYATACFGKWHLSSGGNGGNDNPNLMGFDHYEGSISGSVDSFFDWVKVTNGATSNVTTYATTENVNNALSWMGAQGDNPWFCQVSFNAPHTPYHLPPNNLHSYNLSGTGMDINQNERSYYEASIEAMDTEIGRLLSSMDPSTRANTNVIFVGDNGTPRSVAPGVVRDSKGSLYEGGVHVPFVVSGPSVNSPNRSSDATIHVVDLFATIIDLADINISAAVPADIIYDSLSAEAYLVNANQENIHTFAFAQRFTSNGNNRDGVTLRNGGYKLISLDNGTDELYNLAIDPTESDNLLRGAVDTADQQMYDFLVGSLANIINGVGGNTGDGPVSPTIEFTPDPEKTYYLDNVFSGKRLAASGTSEDAFVTDISVEDDTTAWKFVAKGNGSWHLQLVNSGGSLERLRTDRSVAVDMQATSSSGTYTYFDITPSDSVSGAYHLTLPDGPVGFSRLFVSRFDNVEMQADTVNDDKASFYITEIDENDIEVTNVALGKSTIQSSIAIDPRTAAFTAVDGNTDGLWGARSSMKTKVENLPFWEVDLGAAHDIYEIDLYNRDGSAALEAALSNYTVSVTDSNGAMTFSQTFTNHPDPSILIETGGVIGSSVRVQLNGTGALSFAELEVYGVER